MEFNENLFFYSLIELGLSVLIGVFLLYLTFTILNKFIKEKYSIKTDNVAYSIFASSIILSVGYLISGVKTPILTSLRMLYNNPDYEGIIFLDGLKYTTLFIVIIVLIILIINYISIKLFVIMTNNIDEFKELKNNNIAVALVTGIVIVSISIIVKESVYLILESFIPYPEVPTIF